MMARKCVGLLVMMVFLGKFISVSHAYTATINAASCSQLDVQVAINAATDGDIVMVPAGNCTWSSTLSFSKAITLRGAGSGRTHITLRPGLQKGEEGTIQSSGPRESGQMERCLPPCGGNAGIRVIGTQGKQFRITGFTLNGGSRGEMIYITGTSKKWRVDNIQFNDTGMAYGVWVSGYTYGLIDNCVFNSIGQAVFLEHQEANDRTFWGDSAWTRPIDWGGPNAVYVEDCTFNGLVANQEQVLDGRWGARYVFRRNTVYDYWIEPHSGCPNGGRAVMHSEIYENTFTQTEEDRMWIAVRIRGGTGVIFNNTITGVYPKGPLLIDNQRSCSSCLAPVDTCDGTSPHDGNTPGYYGWPCMDQIGRGTNQANEPLFAWGNTLNGNPVDVEKYGICSRETQYHLVEGRDYYNGIPRPGYTPYMYPHPLRAADSSAPASPSNVRIVAAQ